MHHTVALAASLISLGLVCALYACTVLTGPRSWLRSEVLATILLALLVGLFPLGLGASLVGLWQSLTGGVSLTAGFSAGIDLAGLAAAAVTAAVFRALVAANRRSAQGPTNVTPLTPRPVTPRAPSQPRRKAA